MVINTPKENNPSVLITGANGLLGQKLVELAISSQKYRIIATGKGDSRLPDEWGGYIYERLDITDRSEINRVFDLHRPDFVIHAASMTDVDKCEVERDACYKQNVGATAWILEACVKHSSHLIYLSTDFIFDGKDGPYDEDAPANPLNYYGWSKSETEKTIQSSTVSWAIARTNLVYGIAHGLSRSNIILWVKQGLEMGKELKLVDDQIRTPTLAEDLAAGCLLIIDHKATGIFNISGKDLLTPYDMAIMTADYFGLDKEKIIRTDSSHFTQVAKRPLKTGLKIDKAQRVLGYQPKSFKEGIAILARQFKLASENS